MARNPRTWLNLLYLASNFTATDPRDVIYGLRGLIQTTEGAKLLDPDYSKFTAEVYRDSVEAALLDYETTDVLCYLCANKVPSWIPHWDRDMLFRNPFRFGRPMPWKPAGESKPQWEIDRENFVLSLTGIFLGSISTVEPYRDTYFGDASFSKEDGRAELGRAWKRILAAIGISQVEQASLNRKVLLATAVSFAFGLDDKSWPGETDTLLLRFVAYLRMVLEEAIFDLYIPGDLDEEAREADGTRFGKPIWDFEYPSLSPNRTSSVAAWHRRAWGDVLFVPLGCTYPYVLRRAEPESNLVQGFAFAHDIMHGEASHLETTTVHIR